MIIAIDSTPLSTGHKRRGTGIYTKNLIAALQRYMPKHTYVSFTRRQNVPDGAGIIHYPYFDPFFLTLPVVKPKPVVVTVHDLIPIVFPGHFPPGIRGTIAWQIQKMSLCSAKRIITDSDSSKKDIGRLTGLSSERIDRVYLAPDPIYKPAAHPQLPKTVSKPFMLYVGDVNWNKNIPGLIRAFAEIRQKQNLSLVLVGSVFSDDRIAETRFVHRLIQDRDLGGSVVCLGYVSNTDLAALYTKATVYIQPSFYEGFGLPVLEAMACGCPVVTSDNSSLAEIAGPAIRMQPDNSHSIAGAVIRALTLTAEERNKLIQEEMQWVSTFSWKKVAEETVRTYDKVLAAV